MSQSFGRATSSDPLVSKGIDGPARPHSILASLVIGHNIDALGARLRTHMLAKIDMHFFGIPGWIMSIQRTCPGPFRKKA